MEVSGVRAQSRQRGARNLVDPSLNCHDAVLFQRVGAEPRFHRTGAALTFGDELLKHRHHSDGAYPGADDVVDSFGVRFGLVLSAESREDRAAGEVNGRTRDLTVADAGEDTG